MEKFVLSRPARTGYNPAVHHERGPIMNGIKRTTLPASVYTGNH